MKTETQIAEENIEKFIYYRNTPSWAEEVKEKSLIHLEHCKRELEFLMGCRKEVNEKVERLGKLIVDNSVDGGIGIIIDLVRDFDLKTNFSIKDRIEDLKKAIEIYKGERF